MNFNIDIAIVVGFLIVNLAVGLYFGRGVRNISDYALGGRNFSTGALVATIVSTWVSGSGFFIIISKVYSNGLSYLISDLGFLLSPIILSIIFIPRMESFLGKNSIAEAMGELYGKSVRIVIAIAGVIGSAGSIAIQFNVFGNLVGYFLDIPGNIAIIVAGIIATFYSAVGGIKSVTFTDILQFFAFGFVIPLIGIIIWDHSHTMNFSLGTGLQHPKFNLQYVTNINNPEFLSMIALFLYFAIPHMKPAWFQRVSIGSNIQQVQKAFIISTFLLFIIMLAIAWIPFLLWNINPDLEHKHLISYIIDKYSFTGFKGIIIAAIIAMAMSTADSYINASSVLFSNDFCKPLGIVNKDELLLSRVFAFVLGMGAIALASTTNDLLSIMILANSFYFPVVTPVLILTILGFRTSSKVIMYSMLSGFTTILIWKYLGLHKITGVMIAIIVNFICLITSHYIFKQRGGWIKSKNTSHHFIKKNFLKRKCQEYFEKLRRFKVLAYIRTSFPTDDFTYMGLGIYIFIFTITTMYSTHIQLLKENGRIILYIYQIMMVSGIVLAIYPIWPSKIKKEIVVQMAWPIVIFVELIFFSGFFVMVSDFGHLQFVIFIINILLAVILVGWQLGFVLTLLGFYCSIEFYKYYADLKTIDISMGSPQFAFTYSLVLLGVIIAIFLKPKQEHQEATEAKVDTLETEVLDLNEKVVHYSERISDQEKEIERLGATAQRIINNVNHELRLPVGNVMNFAEMLNDGLGKFNEQQLKSLSDEVYKNSNRLSSMIMNMLDLATLNAKKLELDKKMINLGELVEDRINNCRKIYLDDKKIDFVMKIHPEILILVDPNYMRQVVDNLVINAIKFSAEGVIRVELLKKGGLIEFTIKDNGIGIPKEELYDIFTPFKMGSNTESKAEGRGVGLALCKAAIEAHGGTITAESSGVGAVFRFVLK